MQSRLKFASEIHNFKRDCFFKIRALRVLRFAVAIADPRNRTMSETRNAMLQCDFSVRFKALAIAISSCDFRAENRSFCGSLGGKQFWGIQSTQVFVWSPRVWGTVGERGEAFGASRCSSPPWGVSHGPLHPFCLSFGVFGASLVLSGYPETLDRSGANAAL